MDKLELKSENKVLRFVHSDDHCYNWYQIYFEDNDKSIRLGAEGIDIILSKLIISFLDIKNRHLFNYSEMEMFTVTCVMDPHGIIAGRYISQEEMELIFLDIDGNVIPMMILTEETKIEWITKICSFLAEKR